MDILTHTLSGAAAAAVFMPLHKGGRLKRLTLPSAGALGGAFPDIDALSLWSGFDRHIAPLLDSGMTGKQIYFGMKWYSHHGFMHSLAAGTLITALFLIFAHICRLASKKGSFRNSLLSASAFFTGYLAHLAGDLPTPACTWGGINLFWPSPEYTGGTGHIWWWNNYDLFLIIIAALVLNITICTLLSLKGLRGFLISLTIPALALSIASYQILHREHHYGYRGFTPSYSRLEKLSLEEQKRILGKELFIFMNKLDKLTKINF